MDLINDLVMPFVRVTVETFDSMVGSAINVVECHKVPNRYRTNGVYAMIGFTGDFNGTVAVSFTPETALKIFSRFLGEKVTEIDDDACDAAGEIINIIAGGKSYIKNFSMSMSLPSVIIGDQMVIAMPSDVPVIETLFNSPDLGNVTLLVGLKKTSL